MTTNTFGYQSEIAEHWKSEGLAAGRAEDVLRILDRRGITVPASARERISKCTDLEQLGTWFDEALTAETADDLFL